MDSARASIKAFLAYTGITVALAHSLLPRLGTAIPSGPGDPLLNIWILWWNSRNVPLTTEWWNAPAFFPIRDVLAFSEHLVGLTPLTSPVIWFSGNPLLAYNVAFLLTFVLSAMGARALALTVTRREDAAFVAGLAYGFAPYRMAQLAHIQVLASFWMPLALGALHRYVDDRRPRWLALFAVATAFQGLTNGYYLLFFPVLVALWVLWFGPEGRRLATAGAIVASLAAVALAVLPFLLRYQAVDERFGLGRQLDEILAFSARVGDLLRTDAGLAVWGRWLEASGPEAQLFPGLTCVALVSWAVAWSMGSWAKGSRSWGDVRGVLPAPVRLALAIVASAASLVALARLTLGAGRLDLLGLSVSTGKLSKPLTLALYAWLIVALTGPFVRRLARSRSPLAFYSLATLAMWAFAFGPSGRIGDVEVLYWPPYRWLMILPGFSGLRVPARFGMLAVLCLSAATAVALARVQQRLPHWARILLVVAASGGILAEGWRSVPLLDPPVPSVLRASDAPGAVIELPFGAPLREGQAMYRGMSHLHPVVNGYSGREPAHWIVLKVALPSREPGLLHELAARGVRHVVVFHDEDVGHQWRNYVRSYPGTRRVRTDLGQTLFSLPPPDTPPEGACGGEPLPVSQIVSSESPEEAAKALDGDPDTRWQSSGPQEGGEELDVDLGAPGVVSGVELALGPYYGDFPRELAVDASLDGSEWVALWHGRTSALAFKASVDSPRRVPLRVCFPPVRTRRLRLRQLGSTPQFPWTVAELVVFGVGGSPAAGGHGRLPGRAAVPGAGRLARFNDSLCRPAGTSPASRGRSGRFPASRPRPPSR
jgi:hypothetical protein